MESKDWDGLAEKYHEEVISPFQEGVKNPLFKKLESISDAKRKVVADIGCGRGEILDELASRFGKVFAIDFSPKMIRMAKKKSTKDNIEFVTKDMRDLSSFDGTFDVAIAVNSVLFPNIEDVEKSLASIYSTLKDDGVFYGIFPSMGSILYEGMLILEDQINKKGDEDKAMRSASIIIERRKYNFLKGVYEDGDEAQKFYYDFELMMRLNKAGFKDVLLSKVLYPWKEKVSDFPMFSDKPMMWDWFVSARKK
jgi:ubiquinone/menaquinone biosynthesis C-methylase UbiE